MEAFSASLVADQLRVALLQLHTYGACEADDHWSAHAFAKAQEAYELLQGRMEALIAARTSRANTETLQAFLTEVAKEFDGDLPEDAWHVYLGKGLTPVEAAAEHRRLVLEQM